MKLRGYLSLYENIINKLRAAFLFKFYAADHRLRVTGRDIYEEFWMKINLMRILRPLVIVASLVAERT